MARRCSVCSRPDAGSIAVLLGEGRSVLGIATELGISHDALQRHAQRHVRRLIQATEVARLLPTGNTPPAERVARELVPVMREDPLDELVEALRPHALKGDPQSAHQYRLALQAQADARHAAPPRRALEDEPEWHALRAKVLRALEPHPEAVAALLDALGES